MQITALRAEYLATPLAVPSERPRLSWELDGGTEHDVRQTARRICVTNSGGTVWDSGWVDGDEAIVEYAGPPLAPLRRYEWVLELRTSHGDLAAAPGSFETGPETVHWQQAEWITLRRSQFQHDDHRPTPYLRAAVEVREGLVRARWYVTAGGLFQLAVNDHPVSVGALAPGWTDYETRVPFHGYRLDDLLRPGTNVIGAIVADGWYSGGVGPFHRRNHWGKHPVLRALLLLEYGDGSTELVPTDANWMGRFGPIQSADMLQGTVIDFRLPEVDWASDDAGWSGVTVEDGPAGTLVPAKVPPAQYLEPVPATSVTDSGDGSAVIDFGQNLAGVVSGEITGPVGSIVRIRHAEMLELADNGRIYTDNLRGARATDTLILSGGPDRVEPPFTYHGFRYAEVTGHGDPEQLRRMQALPISSVPRMDGRFTCSDERVNRLHRNIQWTMSSNFVDVLTDCPSRDERMGWTGDAQIFTPTATYQADVAPIYNKWLDDIEDASSPTGAMPDVAPYRPLDWGREGSSAYAEAGIIIPWEMYRAYGDKRVLREAVRRGTAWIDYVRDRAPDLVWREDRNTDYGDWLATVDTPKDLTATAYFARGAQLLGAIGGALGDATMQQRYSALHSEIAGAFQREYLSGDVLQVSTQTAYTVALAFGLLSQKQRARAVADLVDRIEKDGHVTTGFHAVSHLLPLLATVGHPDVALRLLLNDTYPSWLFEVAQGATTIWERWDSVSPDSGYQDPLMNSFNHFARGAVGEFLSGWIAGIRPAVPGFGEIIIDPILGHGLDAASASVPTIRGIVTAGWEREADGYRLEVQVPANATALIGADRTRVGSGSHVLHLP